VRREIPREPLLHFLVLLLHTRLAGQEILFDLFLLVLQHQIGRLLFELRALFLCGLRQEHELLVVLLAQHQFLLLDVLVHLETMQCPLLGGLRAEVFNLLPPCCLKRCGTIFYLILQALGMEFLLPLHGARVWGRLWWESGSSSQPQEGTAWPQGEGHDKRGSLSEADVFAY